MSEIDEQRIALFSVQHGLFTDRIRKKVPRLNKMTTAEVTAALARMAASAGAIADEENPLAGMGFVLDEFMTQLQAQAERLGYTLRDIPGVVEVFKGKGADEVH